MSGIPGNMNSTVMPSQGILHRLQAWRELAVLAAFSMELSWVALWFQLIARTRLDIRYGQAWWVLGGIVLATYLIEEVMIHRDVKLGWRRIIFSGLLLSSMLVGLAAFIEREEWINLGGLISRPITSFQQMADALPTEFMIMLISLFMSWRGVSLAGRLLEPSSIMARFRTGLIMLLFYGLLIELKEPSSVLAFYLFLFSGLMAMSAVRLASQSHRRGGKSIPFDKKWITGLTASILAIVAVSFLMGSWLYAKGIDVLFAAYTWFVAFLILLASPVLWVITKLLEALNDWVRFGTLLEAMRELLQRLQSILSQITETLQNWFASLQALLGLNLSFSIRIPKPIMLWGTIVFFILLILLTVKRRSWKGQIVEEEQLSTMEQPDLIDLLRVAMRKTLARLIGRIEHVFGVSKVRRALAAARIRSIYARLLKLGRRLGTPRLASTTPLEYLPLLEGYFPSLTSDLEVITQAYLQVRYGELPESVEEVQKVEDAWDRILPVGEWLLKARRSGKLVESLKR